MVIINSSIKIFLYVIQSSIALVFLIMRHQTPTMRRTCHMADGLNAKI